MVATLVAAVMAVLAASPAAADVSISSVRPQGDGTVSIVFVVEGGCGDDASTTGFTIEMPEQSGALQVATPDGWTYQQVGHAISLEGDGIGADERAEFIVIARIGGEAGQTLRFPVTQRCDDQTAPTQGGTDADAAPSWVVTADEIDPSMAVVVAPDSNAGASATEVGVAVVIYVLIVGLVGVAVTRRHRD